MQSLDPNTQTEHPVATAPEHTIASTNNRPATPSGSPERPTRDYTTTNFDTDERILRAVQAGAQGYLLKSAPREEVFQAIRIVYAGGSLLQPVVAARLLGQLSGESAPAGLTPCEREVLELLAKGLQNKEIAAVLHIGERTAKFHVSALLRKLGAGNRTEAVALAAQQGLITV